METKDIIIDLVALEQLFSERKKVVENYLREQGLREENISAVMTDLQKFQSALEELETRLGNE
jgi:hypothetical protein